MSLGLADKILEELERLRPASGINVVGIDEYELPGEGYYIIANVQNITEAERVAKEYPDTILFVNPDGIVTMQGGPFSVEGR